MSNPFRVIKTRLPIPMYERVRVLADSFNNLDAGVELTYAQLGCWIRDYRIDSVDDMINSLVKQGYFNKRLGYGQMSKAPEKMQMFYQRTEKLLPE